MFLPQDKQEWWWVYVADRKHKGIVTVPYLVTNLVTEEEVLLKIPAPSKPGTYTYSVICRSDSYVDFDISKNIKVGNEDGKHDTGGFSTVWDSDAETWFDGPSSIYPYTVLL